MDDKGDAYRVLPRNLIKRFILCYHDLPILWNRTHPHYKDRQKRHEAITTLTDLLKEYDPTATHGHVFRKIESLRACVRREHRKVVESRRKATTPEQIYTPTLWYYNIFSFAFENSSGEGTSTCPDDDANSEDTGADVHFDNIEDPQETEIYPKMEFTNVR
ncbi:hypothetical protein ACJJTC_016271 [Scirpophaga incertulas]